METKALAYIHHPYSEMLMVLIKQMYGGNTSSPKHDALSHDSSKLSKCAPESYMLECSCSSEYISPILTKASWT